MKKTKIVLFAVFIATILSSCASAPISQKYPDKWEKTYIGMSLEDFKQVWPEAKYGGTGADIITEIWTVTEKPLLGGSFHIVYFSFQDNKLIRFNEQ